MEISDRIIQQEKKIKKLEMELNDLRQGLTVVQDYYCDLHSVSENRETAENIEQERVKPLNDDDREFDGIWSFHRERLIAEPSAYVPVLKCMMHCPVQHKNLTIRCGTGCI